MTTGPVAGHLVAFGDYTFDARSVILFKHGNWVRVPDQSLRVLAALLENPGQIVSREELSGRLWPEGTHVAFEQGLNSIVKRLRAVLLDSPTAPRYIETLPKRGYRFICPVGSVAPLCEQVIVGQTAAGESRSSGWLPGKTRYRIAIACAFLVLAGAIGSLLYRRVWDRAWSEQARPMVSRSIDIVSDPPGARVSWRPYADLKSKWRFPGTTPLRGLPVSAGTIRVRLSKPGYTDLEIAAPGSSYRLRMESKGSQRGMVDIQAGPIFRQYAGIGRLGPVMVSDFWIDRTEVTNSAYQDFVNAGGYEKPQYWTFQFIENRRTLSWSQAMAKFRDRTGRRAPAGWSAGAYPAGEGDYPVSGVSWYEAAAYANYARKMLPSVDQWFRAAQTDDSAFVIALSNFNGRGPVPVQTRGAVGSFGVYDMAGNVREWCFNETGGMRFALGGAWPDPAYMFTRGQRIPPMNRSLTNGFRCIRSLHSNGSQPEFGAAIPAAVSDRAPLIPVPDEVWQSYKPLYSYAQTNPEAKVESITDSEEWRREKVRFRAGYGNQEVVAYLFLPKQRRPPYQCVVFVPSADAFQRISGDTIQPMEDVLRSGRAMMFPIFWGTFDRFVKLPSDAANAGYPSPVFIREALIAWRKDLGRTLDYLQTRKDIGPIGYLGVSTGAEFAPVLLAEERRVKAAVLLSGAMPEQIELMPESNPVNFARHVTIPVLMLNGRYDSILTAEAQGEMLRLLGTAGRNKAHIFVDSGHGVLAPEVRNEVMRETLVWFDRYLGVSRNR